MENLQSLDLEELKIIFPNRERVFFITLKPAPGNDQNILKICDYLYKKTQEFWIVKCKSKSGFIHFHGLFKVPSSVYDSTTFNAAIHRKMNRDMGFVTITPCNSIEQSHRYIRNERNKSDNFEQQDYYKLCKRD